MWSIVATALTVSYPLLVLGGLARFEPRGVAAGALVLLALRFGVLGIRRGSGLHLSGPPVSWAVALPVVLVLTFTATAAVWNDPLGLLLAPVFVNATLLGTFALSLRGRPIVESIARLTVDVLAPAEIRYCRRVTVVWCAFFLVNGAITLVLALGNAIDYWALYTGFVSYLFMGLLFASEWIYRHARFRRYVGAWTDPLISRFFPPRLAAEIVGVERSRGRISRSIRLEVATGLACWPGHFPGRPMLPGVVQVDWALREIERWLGQWPSITAIEGLKFRHPVLPGDSLVLELAARAEAVEFRFLRGADEVSCGRVRCESRRPRRPEERFDDGSAPRLVLAASAGWPEPADILVHRPPMIWLRGIEGHDARSTSAIASVADCGALALPGGRVAAHVAIEWMAQCIAAHAGLERRASQAAPALGFLLGSRSVRFARSAYDANETFRVVAVRNWGDDRGAASFDCRVEELESGRWVAEARLSCFSDGGESEVGGMQDRSERDWTSPRGGVRLRGGENESPGRIAP